jgi:hypothetical protein
MHYINLFYGMSMLPWCDFNVAYFVSYFQSRSYFNHQMESSTGFKPSCRENLAHNFVGI